MPKFLEDKMGKEYGKGNPIIYATMNKLGFMKGSKETAKGTKAESDHLSKIKKKAIKNEK